MNPAGMRNSRMKIEWIRDLKLEEDILLLMQTASDRCLECEGVRIPCSITVRLCSDETIAEINASFRNIPHPTDVLSFPTLTFPPNHTAGDCEKLLHQEYDDDTDACFLGDIIISVPHILAQADEYGHSVGREAAYLLVHGICHLMGYDHMTEKDRKKMRNMEEKILSAVPISRY